MSERSGDNSRPKHGLWAVVKSALAAFVGVQSSENRQRDFEHGNPLAFIIAGVIGTIVFIATVALVVGYVTSR
ncbi:DUF2970 domain-containing protein [Gammaproteobacteria bacterium LSUCC0057]|uniref:DUF2970 domain-containing protein n=1 Tax=Gammaproteobacteria bacterium LSUCC0057 TaxID=2559237 RepID=A0A4Y8UJL5_9GAMM|nr:DUF2970 domain-containing protein [Gammaproteobacteria bacterium LSUCC0057]